MAHVDWYIEGRSFGNCNCAYSCPCQFEELPTHGDCQGFDIVEVDEGHFGETDLAGLRAATIYAFPGPVFEGGGTMQVVIDERARHKPADAGDDCLSFACGLFGAATARQETKGTDPTPPVVV